MESPPAPPRSVGVDIGAEIGELPVCRLNAEKDAGPGVGFENPDGLDEYGDDFQNFAKPDDRMIAEMVERRRQARTRPHGVEETASPAPVLSEPPASLSVANAEIGPDLTSVRMTSRGLTLIVGRNAEEVRACGRRLAPSQPCLMLVEGPSPAHEAEKSRLKDLMYVSNLRIRGHLGRFQTCAGPRGREADPIRALLGAPAPVDLVLDLRPEAAAVPVCAAMGYYAVPEGDGEELERVLAELPQMIGVFEKPRFVSYAAESCAHARSGLTACGRCIAVCPLEAIGTAHGGIRIDHAACLGCGMCATVCPTGAIRCLQASREELLASVQERLSETRLGTPTVVFHPPEADDGRLQAAFGRTALRIPLNEIGRAGPEVWLGALASGAGRVAVQLPDPCPVLLRDVLGGQLEWVWTALAGLGLSPGRIRLVPGPTQGNAEEDPADTPFPPAELSPPLTKRALIRRSLAHLAVHSGKPNAVVDLPPGAPFGAVAVDASACTLCMACVGACPTAALSAAGDAPALKLMESECIQCGRCREICPEHAVALQPRFLPDPVRCEYPRLLHAQEPFECIRCGKAFASAGMVARMTERLDGHWMYAGEEEKRRLKMCRDCRVRDIFSRRQEERP